MESILSAASRTKNTSPSNKTLIIDIEGLKNGTHYTYSLKSVRKGVVMIELAKSDNNTTKLTNITGRTVTVAIVDDDQLAINCSTHKNVTNITINDFRMHVNAEIVSSLDS
jgi:ABC-type molybdate transport system ATPase subunit